MSDLNICTFTGRLTKEPEVRVLDSGMTICRITLAVNRRYKDREDTLFLECSIFGTMAETLSPLLKKGMKVAVSGRLTQRKWMGEDGIQRTGISLYVNDLALVEKKNGDEKPKAGKPVDNEEEPDIPF